MRERHCSTCGQELEYLVRNFCPFCGNEIPISEKFQNAIATSEREIDFLDKTQGQILGTPQFVDNVPMACTNETHLRMAKAAAALKEEKEQYPDIAHLSPEPSRFCHNCGKELPTS